MPEMWKQLFRWGVRHPVVLWSTAWFATGVALAIGDMFSDPRYGPIWIPVVVGTTTWGAAGAAATAALIPAAPNSRVCAVGITWAIGYLIALGLGEVLASWIVRQSFDGTTYAGFIGVVLAWAIGATVASLVGFWLVTGAVRSIVLALVWGSGFLVGSYFAVVFAYVLSQLVKNALQDIVGWRSAYLGW